MPTDPDDTSDVLAVGLRLLLTNNNYSSRQIAAALFSVLSDGNQVYPVMYALESFTDVIQPIQIHVSDIIDYIDDEHYEAIGDHAKLDDGARRGALRARMHAEFINSEEFSAAKWRAVEGFVEDLEEDGWVKKSEPGETDETATSGAGDSV